MTQPVRPIAALSERVEKLEQDKVTYREATVLAVDAPGSTFDADVANTGRLNGISAPPQFLPAVGDTVRLEMFGAVAVYRPQRVGAGTVGVTELAGYVNTQITTALDTATGKNKVSFSLVDPSGLGTTAGDVWFKRTSPAGVITGSWEWDGDSWEPRTYGDQVLSSLTVGKLVGGTATFDLVVGGRVTTALTDQRVELNPLGIQGFDSTSALTLHLDGIANLITGTTQTALTGRRIVMGAAGSSGLISFFAPDGKQGFVFSKSENATTGVEAIQFGMSIPGATGGLWNRINYNSDEWASYRANIHEFMFATDQAMGGSFKVYQTTNRGGSGAVTRQRLGINGGGATYWDTSGMERLSLTSSDIQLRGTDAFTRLIVTDTEVLYMHPGTNQRISFQADPPATVISPMLRMIANSNYGSAIHYWEDSPGVNGRVAFVDWGRAFYMPIWAASFVISSSDTVKANRRRVGADEGIEIMRSVKVTEFSRLTARRGGPPVASARRELGVIAEELHEALRLDGDGEHGPMWDIGPTVAAIISAIQNLDVRLTLAEKGKP